MEAHGLKNWSWNVTTLIITQYISIYWINYYWWKRLGILVKLAFLIFQFNGGQFPLKPQHDLVRLVFKTNCPPAAKEQNVACVFCQFCFSLFKNTIIKSLNLKLFFTNCSLKKRWTQNLCKFYELVIIQLI